MPHETWPEFKYARNTQCEHIHVYTTRTCLCFTPVSLPPTPLLCIFESVCAWMRTGNRYSSHTVYVCICILWVWLPCEQVVFNCPKLPLVSDRSSGKWIALLNRMFPPTRKTHNTEIYKKNSQLWNLQYLFGPSNLGIRFQQMCARDGFVVLDVSVFLWLNEASALSSLLFLNSHTRLQGRYTVFCLSAKPLDKPHLSHWTWQRRP